MEGNCPTGTVYKAANRGMRYITVTSMEALLISGQTFSSKQRCTYMYAYACMHKTLTWKIPVCLACHKIAFYMHVNMMQEMYSI